MRIVSKKKKEKKGKKNVSKATLERIPRYYSYIKGLDTTEKYYISSVEVAKGLKLNSVQVRTDLALVSSIYGKPRAGFHIEKLLQDMETFLGFNKLDNVILVGAGRLGQALLSYEGFNKYGFNILAAFDNNPSICGTIINEKEILNINELKDYVQRMNVKIGIISLPRKYAQDVCDLMVDAGIKGILNFTQQVLSVPDNVVVQEVNFVASLAILGKKLKSKK